MKKILLFGFIFIMMFSLVLAQPPFQSLDSKLTLETVLIQEHPINTEFYLHTHVYDSETGLILSDSLNCSYHLYSENINWQHLDEGSLSPYGVGYYSTINKTNFNQTGKYAILLWCEQESDFKTGGFIQYNFEVFDKGSIFEFNSTTLYFIIGLIIFLLIISFALKQALFGLIAGLVMLIMSLYLISTLMIIGVILTIVSIMLILLFLFNL